MYLNFNIIYTAGNVRYLRLFILSLLKWSDCTFRLVSNDCREEEEQILREFCQNNPRLEFLSLPFDGMVPHGKALTYLQQLEKSQYFCFMDSDIFATGDFIAEFRNYFGQYCGIFSGTAIWLDEASQVMPPGCKGIGGRFNHTADGLCLGSTFFAIYENDILNKILREYAITFDKYYQWDEIAVTVRQEIENLNLQNRRYDTAKILNLLLICNGYNLIYKDAKTLCHLGGLSTVKVGPLSKVPPKGVKRMLKDFARLFSAKGLNKIAQKIFQGQKIVNIDYEKRDIADYFTNLMDSLFAKEPFTKTIRVHDLQVLARIKEATRQIETLYKEFEPKLYDKRLPKGKHI